MESLHYGEILDESCINDGFNRAIVTGNISLFWGQFVSAFGVAESPEGDGRYACPAGGYFSVMKSRQKNFI